MLPETLHGHDAGDSEDLVNHQIEEKHVVKCAVLLVLKGIPKDNRCYEDGKRMRPDHEIASEGVQVAPASLFWRWTESKKDQRCEQVPGRVVRHGDKKAVGDWRERK